MHGNGVGSQRVEGGYFETRWKGVSLKRAGAVPVSWFPWVPGFLVSWFPWVPGFLVSWFPAFLGFLVFLVSWFPWFPGFLGFAGFLVSLVSWFPWFVWFPRFLGFLGFLLSLVSWFPWFPGVFWWSANPLTSLTSASLALAPVVWLHILP